MSARDITVWTCDACGTTEKRDRDRGPSLYWIGVTFHKTATHADSSRRLHICAECKTKEPIAALLIKVAGLYR